MNDTLQLQNSDYYEEGERKKNGEWAFRVIYNALFLSKTKMKR